MSSLNAEHVSKEFIALLKEKEAYALLPEIVAELQAEVFRNQDISVISAEDLSGAQQKEISSELIAKWGEHKVLFSTDASILSGLIIRFQDNILDLSGRSGLNELRTALI